MSARSNESGPALTEESEVSEAEQAATEIRRHIDHIDAQIADLRGQRTELVRHLASVWSRL